MNSSEYVVLLITTRSICCHYFCHICTCICLGEPNYIDFYLFHISFFVIFEWRCGFGSDNDLTPNSWQAVPSINDELTDSWHFQPSLSWAKIDISFSRVYVKSISLVSHLVCLFCHYHYGNAKIHGIKFDWHKLSLTLNSFNPCIDKSSHL